MLHSELSQNAAYVPSILGGRTHGHLGLVLPEEIYAMLIDAPFFIPPFPSGVPNVPENTSGPNQTIMVQNHNEVSKQNNYCVNMQLALKKLIVATIDEVYIASLKEEHVRHQHVTITNLKPIPTDHSWKD